MVTLFVTSSRNLLYVVIQLALTHNPHWPGQHACITIIPSVQHLMESFTDEKYRSA